MPRKRRGHAPITPADLVGLRSRGYVRESTEGQGEGFSPDAQRASIERWATEHGLLAPDRFYVDLVSGSGALQRSDFQAMIRDAEAGTFDVLLVHNTSRFARNREDAMAYKRKLAAAGVAVVFCQQSLISGDEHRFIEEGVNELFDEFYSRQLASWVRLGLRQKFEAGYHNGTAPLGYRRANDRELAIVPAEAALVRSIYERYATGAHSYASLCDALNAEGALTKRGQLWTKGSLETLLGNRLYVGDVVWHPGAEDEQVRAGRHDPILTPDLFDRAQRARQRHDRAQGSQAKHRVYPLSGLAVCATCGARYHGVPLGKYRFRALRHFERSACSARSQSLNCQTVEKQLGLVLQALRLPRDVERLVARIVAGTQGQDLAEARRTSLERRLDRLKDLYVAGDLDRAAYEERRGAIKSDLAAMPRPQPVDLARVESAVAMLRQASKVWERAPLDAQRDIAREVFAAVQMEGPNVVGIVPTEAYEPLFTAGSQVRGRGERALTVPGLAQPVRVYGRVYDMDMEATA